MLTIEKLAVLIKYHWNFRHFEEHGSVQEKELMDVDWEDIGEVVQDLQLYHKNLVSKEYAAKIHSELLAVCADETTAQTLLGYASTL